MGFNISKRIYGGPMSPKVFNKLWQRQLASSPRHAANMTNGAATTEDILSFTQTENWNEPLGALTQSSNTQSV